MIYYIIIIYIYILNWQIENSVILLCEAYNCKSVAFVANFKLYKMVLKLI